MSTTATQHAPCGLCNHDIPEGEVVTLWNDKSYCAECLKKNSEALFEYATQHETLKEEFPTPSHIKTKKFQLLYLPIITLLSQGLLWFSIFSGEHHPGFKIFVLIYAVVFLLSFPFMVRLTFQQYRWRKYIQNLASIECMHGEIHIHNRVGQLVKTVPLTNVKCVYFDNEPMSVDYCLALHTKKQKGWKPNLILAYCGHTPEMKKVWKDFFKLSGVPVEY